MHVARRVSPAVAVLLMEFTSANTMSLVKFKSTYGGGEGGAGERERMGGVAKVEDVCAKTEGHSRSRAPKTESTNRGSIDGI